MMDTYIKEKESHSVFRDCIWQILITICLFGSVIFLIVYYIMDTRDMCHKHFNENKKYLSILQGKIIDIEFLKKYHEGDLKCSPGTMSNGTFYETIDRRTKLDVEIIMNNSLNKE